MPPDPKAIDALYDLPPEEFTAARDALARELRQNKDRAAADEVKALRRPTAPAWLVNQLARRRPKQLERLLTVGERLRKARSADELRSASAQERELTANLLRAARDLARDAPDAMFERVRETLHAAVADPGIAEEVTGGRLARERQFVGFGAGAPLPGGARPKAAKAATAKRAAAAGKPARSKPVRAPKADSAAKHRAEAQARAAAKKERERLDRAIKGAERQVVAAEKAQAAKREHRERAEAAEQKATDAVREAQAALDELQARR